MRSYCVDKKSTYKRGTKKFQKRKSRKAPLLQTTLPEFSIIYYPNNSDCTIGTATDINNASIDMTTGIHYL